MSTSGLAMLVIGAPVMNSAVPRECAGVPPYARLRFVNIEILGLWGSSASWAVPIVYVVPLPPSCQS